jgi:hypothetical protein
MCAQKAYVHALDGWLLNPPVVIICTDWRRAFAKLKEEVDVEVEVVEAIKTLLGTGKANSVLRAET